MMMKMMGLWSVEAHSNILNIELFLDRLWIAVLGHQMNILKKVIFGNVEMLKTSRKKISLIIN